MWLKFLAKRLLFSVGIVVIVSSVITIFLSIFNRSAQIASVQSVPSIVPANPTVAQPRVGLPTRLKIPKINVDASVEYVGINSKGEMDVPKLPGNTAWYDLGTRPGDIGSAAIAGHLNWYDGATGVFADLDKLKIGDKILVQDETGKEISFVVRKIRTYELNEDASEVFVSNDGKAYLNLITCDGVWDKVTKQYSKRLVVFAEME